MKTLTDDQYERLARWLDGEAVELTAAERDTAEEVRRDEAHLAKVFGVAAPRVSLDRARRRLIAELSRPRRLVWRIALAASAAAAAILLAVILMTQGTPGERTTTVAKPTPPPPAIDEARLYVAAAREMTAPDEIDFLGRDLDELAADIVMASDPALTTGGALELQIDSLEREIDEFYLDEALGRPLEG